MNDYKVLLESYAAGPEELRQAIAGMSAEELRSRPVPGKWSTHEVVCHLADFEIVNAERIQRVLSEEQPTIFNAEPDDFAERLAYSARDVEQQLQLIAAVRAHVAAILSELSPEHWERTGTHSTDGPLTVKEIVRRVTSHIPHHIRFIAEKRKALADA